MDLPPSLPGTGSFTPRAHRLLLTLSLSLSLLWIYCGQVFLAHNADNDADSSFFVYGAKVLLAGGTLYKDFWDQKPPMIFWQNALLLKLFGRDFHLWAWVHGLSVLGLSLLWLREMRLRVGTPLASVGLLAFAYMFNSNKVLDFGNRTEFGVACMEMLALILMMQAWRKEEKRSLVLAGVASAMAFLYKPVGMASLLATLAWCSLGLGRKNSRSTLLLCLAGFLGALLLMSFPYFLRGQWMAIMDAAIFTPLGFSNSGTPGPLNATWNTLLRLGPFWGIGLGLISLPFGLWLSIGKERDQLLWVGLWFLATLCGIILQRHGRPHYDHPLALPMVTLIVLALRPILSHLKSSFIRFVLPLIWLSSIAFFGQYFILQQVNLALDFPELQKERFTSYHKVSDALNQELKPGETFYYWSLGFTPYLLTERFSPGRLSPSILTFGGKGVDMVRQDLERVKSHRHLVFLLENPEVFPKDLLRPQSPNLQPEARALVEEYLAWRDRAFVPLDRPDLHPFLLYRKKGHR